MTRGSPLAFLLWIFFSTVGGAQQDSVPPEATNAERSTLLAAGFPLLDTSAWLSPEARASIVSEQTALAQEQGLDLVILLQAQSLTGDAAQDLIVLREQVQRSGLWTPTSSFLLIQQEPPLALVARPERARLQTRLLTQDALRPLRAAAGTAALGPLLLETLTALRRGDLSAPPSPARAGVGMGLSLVSEPWREALLHSAAFGLLALLPLLVLRLLRGRMGGGMPSRSARWMARQTLPRSFARALYALEPVDFAEHLRLVWQRRPHRHWGLAWMVSVLVAFAVGLWLEPITGALPAWLVDRGGWVLEESWLARLGATGMVFAVIFATLLGTRLGAWLTPPPWRKRLLRQDLSKRAAGHPYLMLVWQASARTLELWQTAAVPPRLVTPPLHRLAADLTHGEGLDALDAFLDDLRRLAEAYPP